MLSPLSKETLGVPTTSDLLQWHLGTHSFLPPPRCPPPMQEAIAQKGTGRFTSSAKGELCCSQAGAAREHASRSVVHTVSSRYPPCRQVLLSVTAGGSGRRGGAEKSRGKSEVFQREKQERLGKGETGVECEEQRKNKSKEEQTNEGAGERRGKCLGLAGGAQGAASWWGSCLDLLRPVSADAWKILASLPNPSAHPPLCVEEIPDTHLNPPWMLSSSEQAPCPPRDMVPSKGEAHSCITGDQTSLPNFRQKPEPRERGPHPLLAFGAGVS